MCIRDRSKQWVSVVELAPKKAKTVPSAHKMMATVVWDACGITLIDFLEKGKTITGLYYTSLLDHLYEEIKKLPHLRKKKILVYQYNAPAHGSGIVSAKLLGLCLLQPPYSPDFATLDYYLFPDLKKWLAGKRCTRNDEVIATRSA